MTDQVSVLLSGPGLIGLKHLELLKRNPNTCIAAIVAPPSAETIAAATQFSVPIYNDIESAIASETVHAAIISSPNVFHYDQALTCIENRIPVLVEKPLTDSLQTAKALCLKSEQTMSPVLVGHHRTYSPLLKVAKSFLNSKKFGRPVSVQGSALFYKPKEYFESGPWRIVEGGGPILINMIHEVGILRFMFGEIASVSAKFSSTARGFAVEDTVAMTFSFECGALGTFILSDASCSSKSWEMTAGENPAYPCFPDQNCYHFSGDMGSLDFPTMHYRTYDGSPKRSWWEAFDEGVLPRERIDPLEAQLNHFVDVVRNNAKPIVPARDGYMNMVVLEAIREAARSGREIHISEVSQ